MLIRKFDLEKDYNTINEWSIARNLGPIPKELLPKIGFIVDNVACGFVIQTDTKVAYGEFLISNPTSTKEQRNVAIDSIMNRGFEKARDLGYLIFYVNVSNPVLHERFEKELNMVKVIDNCRVYSRSL